MSDPTKPPPRPPGPWDHEDPPDGARPKSPKKPTRTPHPLKDGSPKSVTLGWADEPAAPRYLTEVIRSAAIRRTSGFVTVEASADWKGILSAARDGDPIPEELDDAAPCPVCISTPCGCEEE